MKEMARKLKQAERELLEILRESNTLGPEHSDAANYIYDSVASAIDQIRDAIAFAVRGI